MSLILAPVAEVRIFKNDGSKDLIYMVEKFDGAVAVAWGFTVTDHADSPIANHAAQVNTCTLYELSEGEYKAVDKGARGGHAVLRRKEKKGSTELDGQALIEGNVKQKTITAELNRPGQRDPALQRWENSHRIRVKFEEEALVKEWLDIDHQLRYNKNGNPDAPDHAKPVPTCKVCGRYKCNNAHYAAARTMHLPVRPWEQEFVCNWCIEEFAGLSDHLKNEVVRPSRTIEEVFKLCKALLRIAEDGLDDPLAIAAAKINLATTLKPQAAVPLLEDAYRFLSHHDDEDVREASFSSQMDFWYHQTIWALGKWYADSGAIDKAQVLLEQGLDFDEKAGNKFNILISKRNMGELYIRMGRLDDAEALLLDLFEHQSTSGGFTGMQLVLESLVTLYAAKGDREKVQYYGYVLGSLTGALQAVRPELDRLMDSKK